MREGLGKAFLRLKCMQEWYLGWEKVSCLEQFRSVLSLECPHRKREDALTVR